MEQKKDSDDLRKNSVAVWRMRNLSKDEMAIFHDTMAGPDRFRIIAISSERREDGSRQKIVRVTHRGREVKMPDGRPWWPAYWFEKEKDENVRAA